MYFQACYNNTLGSSVYHNKNSVWLDCILDAQKGYAGEFEPGVSPAEVSRPKHCTTEAAHV